MKRGRKSTSKKKDSAPPGLVEAREAVFKQMYEGAEQSFRKALGVMQTDVNSKKALKFVVRFQKRLSLCKSFLIDIFRLDWEKFRPLYLFTYHLENTSGFCHFGKKNNELVEKGLNAFA